MHQRNLSALPGVSHQQTTQDQVLWRSRQRRGSMRHCLCPPTGAALWAWLLLGALVVPGAWSFLNEEQEELLVELHNHYRGQVSPSASAMLPLKWDPGLKLIAEAYAAKCTWNHNPDLEETGENLFAGTGHLDLRLAMEKWFLEHLDYNFENNSCDEDKMCGHYTQMVWADTHKVGCAFHLCNSMEGLDWERVSFLVCNYYPPGNYEGERPYVEGDWCSRCPENLQKCENNMCVADTLEEDEEKTVPPSTATDAQTDPTGAASTPRIMHTISPFAEDIDTPTPGTLSTQIPSTTPGEEEEEEEEKEEKEEEEEEKGAMNKMEEKELELPKIKLQHSGVSTVSAAPSLLLVALTGILILRL
uniref:Peptidase inhibitor 16 n=1 Tax=Mastacembelus armatus TaxID=205130 RepID=A0A3Q3M225_9TELE